MTSDIPAVGELMISPWKPRRIIEIKPYRGKYQNLGFDCVLVIAHETNRSGQMRMAYRSSDWSYDQHLVSEWIKENGPV